MVHNIRFHFEIEKSMEAIHSNKVLIRPILELLEPYSKQINEQRGILHLHKNLFNEIDWGLEGVSKELLLEIEGKYLC